MLLCLTRVEGDLSGEFSYAMYGLEDCPFLFFFISNGVDNFFPYSAWLNGSMACAEN